MHERLYKRCCGDAGEVVQEVWEVERGAVSQQRGDRASCWSVCARARVCVRSVFRADADADADVDADHFLDPLKI